MLPFDFTVEGVPISLQASGNSKTRWKQKVRQEALAIWPPNAPPIIENVQVTITYYYDKEALDVDNMLKPILDALNGLVYVDDTQVTDVCGRKRDIQIINILTNLSPLLLKSLTKGVDFVHIEIDLAPI